MPPDLPEWEKVRVFGSYHIGDLPVRPKPLGVSELLRILRRPALSRGFDLLKMEGILREVGFWGWFWTRGLRFIPDPPEKHPISPLLGPKTLEGRLKSNLLISFLRRKSAGEKA